MDSTQECKEVYSKYTPYFYITQKARYERQTIIREIQNETKRKLIVYYSLGSIGEQDVAPFTDLLHRLNSDNTDDLDLFLHTNGGSIDIAEKIVYMCRYRSKSLRVIVPERAKSAGTLISLAADEIVMGYASELGPIDPQIVMTSADGKMFQAPAQSYIDGLEYISSKIEENPGSENVYFPMLSNINPALIDTCIKAKDRSKKFATKWLCEYMLRDDPCKDEKSKEIAEKLCNVKEYLSHGMAINPTEASEIGLKVKFLDHDDPLWQRIWALYISYNWLATHEGKGIVFEGDYASIIF